MYVFSTMSVYLKCQWTIVNSKWDWSSFYRSIHENIRGKVYDILLMIQLLQNNMLFQ